MRVYILLVYCFFVCVPSIAQIGSPKEINGLILWYSADSSLVSSGSSVSQWTDLSGNNNNALQSDNSHQPKIITNAINGKAALSFDGTSAYLLTPLGLLDNLSQLSIFAVINLRAVANAAVFGSNLNYNNLEIMANQTGVVQILNNAFNSRIVDGGYFTLNNYTLSSIIANKTVGFAWKNTIDVTQYQNAANLPIGTGTQQALGRFASSFGNYYANFEIAEFVIYNKDLTQAQRVSVENYLRHKYAPPVALGKDINHFNGFCDTLLDAGAIYTSYLWSTGETTRSISTNKTGMYWVKVKDIFGFESTDSINVSYPPLNYVGSSASCIGSKKVWSIQLPKKNYTFLWSDNSTDSLLDITLAGSYFVDVKDKWGCTSSSDTVSVFIDNYPLTASLGPDTNFCAGNPIYLKTGAAQAASYVWSDGSTNSSLPVIVAGQYSVTAISINGCVKKDTINIGISGVAPTASFSITPKTCVGSTTQFTDASSPPVGNSIVSSVWDFGDASPVSNSISPSYKYADTGSYTAKLTVTTNVGCSASLSKKVTVAPYPQPNFTVSNLCERDSVLFNGIATIYGFPITQWGWSFGDAVGAGFASVLQNPKHLYATAATYTVSLTIQNTYGCATTINNPVVIQPAPVTNYSTSMLCEKQTISFTDNTTVLPSMAIQAGVWDFGDNTGITVLINPIHTYSLNGKYVLTHTMTATNGCSNTLIQTLTVNPKPTALYTSGKACVGIPTTFSDTSLISLGSIANRLWTYGAGGSTSTLKNDFHLFVATISPQVKLLVTSDQGCKDSITKTIIVRSTPVANYTATPNNGAPPLNVNFTNSSIGAANYAWDLGNTSIDTLQNTHTVYTDTGSFKVSLIATSQYGCADTSIQNIDVLLPVIDVAVQNLTTTLNNNFMTVEVLLVNKGTVDVTSLDITVRINDGTALKEQWTGLLSRGGVVLDTINTTIYLKDPKRFICVSAVKPNGLDDQYPSDNESCIAIDKSTFVVLEPYPVPAGEVLTLPVLIPAANNLDVTVYNSRGQSLGLVYSGAVSEGLQLIAVNLTGVEKGVYVFSVLYNGQRVVKRFVID